jgi:hypothetical protein
MQRTTRFVVLGLVAMGVAAAVVVNNGKSSTGEPATPIAGDFDNTAATEQRIRALEIAVSEERRARQLLEDELLAIYADLEVLQAAPARPRVNAAEDQAAGAIDADPGGRSRRELRGDQAAVRLTAMVEAGLAPDRADYILRRESEMRYEAMQAAFEARNAGESVDRFSPAMNPDAMLRGEIGDSDYEKYLEAQGRPTSVGVASVMASSPAERAGLQTGDEIVGYDGKRVFSSYELMQQTMTAGDGNVVIDVVRDGVPLQIVVPRGPIGVEIGRFRGR